MARLALLAACLAGLGAASAAAPAAADPHAHKHRPKHEKQHAAPHAKQHTKQHMKQHMTPSTGTHAQAHKPAHQPARAHAPAHAAAHKPVRKPTHVAASLPAATPAHRTVRVAAPAASPAPVQPLPRALPRPSAANTDRKGEGFLNLYVELCVKRIGDIDAFHDKLLREKVPRLQPDSAKAFLAGMAGDAWPVPYQGKMGNFVLVLPAQKNVCMLYARRTDTAAVEQGFADMVAKPPEPMIARRGPETHADTPGNGATRTVSTSWAPPGSERKMQFMLTTSASPDAQVQALGSVAIVVGADPGPGPERAGAGATSGKPARTPNGSPAPARRPPGQP